MAKEPIAGRVKTRLGREIGMVRAAWWFRHRLAHLVRSLSDPRWDTLLAVTPDTAIASPAFGPMPRLAQGSGDLGTRMARVFRTLPPGPVLIVGADVPGITCTHIASAFKALGRHEAAIGPAPDGGYWAIGLKRRKPTTRALFSNVRWSSPYAMADTLATMPGLDIARLPMLTDVDTAAEFARLSR
ncbi:MAG TPA: glycosyltransferase [Rhodobacterales bacterium]|nr:glycosyltransferase [Rhodobacterales bacterium]